MHASLFLSFGLALAASAVEGAALTADQTPGTRNTKRICWPNGTYGDNWLDWHHFKANGVNLGGWLEKEKTHDPLWWSGLANAEAAATADEWSLCQALGPADCSTVLEDRYASFLNTSTIDKLAGAGVNVLRVPTTYAAWVDVPGSMLYHGNQQKYLRDVVVYAIERYSMHVIIGLHSLPGGVNSLEIGEAFGHDAWFYSESNLVYSYQAVSAVLDFMQSTGHLNAFSFEPINEASDNLAGFGSPAGLTQPASDWVVKYVDGVLDLVEAVDKRIPVIMQDCFMGTAYWEPLFDASRNLVLSPHVYWWAANGAYSQWITGGICGQSQFLAESTKFPVFVGEWALQVRYNNTFDNRKTLFDTQRWAFQNYVAGGTFWTAVSYAQAAVDGEGLQEDYWSYIKLIDAGVITKQTNSSYC